MFSTRPYTPKQDSWPYTDIDFQRMDSSPDSQFYQSSRLVTHIDEKAIELLGRYYSENLPRTGRILDLCSSWISHLPPELEVLARKGFSVGPSTRSPSQLNNGPGELTVRNDGKEQLELIGLGMNQKELSHNPILSERILQDLNIDPVLPASLGPLDAITCVVSIDYLTRPLDVLQSANALLASGSFIHLVISNRCFPTKVIRRWLRIDEMERLNMVGDYLHFAGFNKIEIITLNEGRWSDPLWVVRGMRAET